MNFLQRSALMVLLATDKSLLGLALAVRITQAMLIRTAFAPDETWQSIEVAHRLVFGYGHLTWEWVAGLRSYAHPLLFAAPYAALNLLGLDTVWTVTRVPLLLQALCAALTDVYVARLARLVFGPGASIWCMVCQLASWFNAYCLVRTYSNSIEALAVVAGSYHFLLNRNSAGLLDSQQRQLDSRESRRLREHQRIWLAWAAASVIFRPSSALFWVVPAAIQLFQQPCSSMQQLLVDGFVFAGGPLVFGILIDRVYYHRWVIVPWEFFRFNLLMGASAQYGQHPWHWNMSQGLPAIFASMLPLLLVGILLSWRNGRASDLAALACWSVVCYSLPAHKEFRFLLPVQQLLMPYCGLAAAKAARHAGSWGQGSRGTSSRTQTAGWRGQAGGNKLHSSAWQQRQTPAKYWIWATGLSLVLQPPVAAYFMLVHHRAQVDVMHHIQRQPEAQASVLFLTPCHATPYYTHVHQRIPMRFLDCSPPQYAAATAEQNRELQEWLPLPEACPLAPAGSSLSQRQCFELNRTAYLQAVLAGRPPSQLPQQVVGYSAVMQELAGSLQQRGYQARLNMTNCWVQTDPDSPCQMQLWSL